MVAFAAILSASCLVVLAVPQVGAGLASTNSTTLPPAQAGARAQNGTSLAQPAPPRPCSFADPALNPRKGNTPCPCAKNTPGFVTEPALYTAGCMDDYLTPVGQGARRRRRRRVKVKQRRDPERAAVKFVLTVADACQMEDGLGIGWPRR